MKKMFLIFSHKLTKEQIQDAKKRFEVEEFIPLPENLQKIWSNINPSAPNANKEVLEIAEWLSSEMKHEDIVLVQGDFGATFYIVNVVKNLGGFAVYATTKREVIEIKNGDKIEKKSVFKHMMFREYIG